MDERMRMAAREDRAMYGSDMDYADLSMAIELTTEAHARCGRHADRKIPIVETIETPRAIGARCRGGRRLVLRQSAGSW